MIALVSAIFGFGGLLDASAKFMQTIAFFAMGLSAISFLLGLFEEDTPPSDQPDADPLESVQSQGSWKSAGS